MDLITRIQHAWNAFTGVDDDQFLYKQDFRDLGLASYYKPDRVYLSPGNEKSIITSIYNRISIDCSLYDFRHVKTDDSGNYLEDVDSGLNSCLSLSANKDQTGRAFIQDVVTSMLNEGCVAIVPIDTTGNPELSDSWDINSMRVGKITQWYPDYVKVDVYNDRTGKHSELVVEKRNTAIIENPLYAVMNEPNSFMKRLIRKLNLLDAIDEQSGSGKLDLIIQLPYVVRTDLRRAQAEARRADIEKQLSGSKYGIAYTDGTERVTQLNRPIENNLLAQIEYLTRMLYSQLGFKTEILDGSADEKTMTNYRNRTIDPILLAISEEMKRKFLTKTALTQKQSIMYFGQPLRTISPTALPDFADKFTRNEILSSNEIRQAIGLKPSKDPKANELRNKNLNEPTADSKNPPGNDSANQNPDNKV